MTGEPWCPVPPPEDAADDRGLFDEAYAQEPGGHRQGQGDREAGFDWLPDAVAEAKAWGHPIVYETDGEPHPATRRLMDSLGVPVVSRSVSQPAAPPQPDGGASA